MSRTLALLAICLLAAGCMGQKEEISILETSVSKNGNSYRGRVIAQNSGEATYKMCVIEMRGGDSGKSVIKTVEKTMSAGPGAAITINIDERIPSVSVTQVAVCCYKSEAYSGNPTCSNRYNIQ
ncbi:MAG: hypothetical protein V1875_01575 [Candidatus Altiarchaeota archaeon]